MVQYLLTLRLGVFICRMGIEQYLLYEAKVRTD